ncbi:VOC family protein [Patulibacter americanus]|uniref:VOC family protein n=1 Tax=Patulibacter americanus TaxID=588672 RepID=UPI0003B723C4|nr:VOC family protein [Patulibacter americanus]
MPVTTTTHLNFRGTAREALTFYAEVFGGQVHVNTYGDFGMPQELPGADKVVFGQVQSADGFRVMAYDIPGQDIPEGATTGSTRRENGMTITDRPFFVSVTGETLDEVTGPWEALSAGATVIEALAPSAWSPGFGMLTDRFGVTWTFGVTAPDAR